MKPVGELALGTGERLRLIECGGEVLLLGVTSSRVNLLRSYPVDRFDLPEPEAGDAASFPNTHFAEVLQRFARQSIRSESNGSIC